MYFNTLGYQYLAGRVQKFSKGWSTINFGLQRGLCPQYALFLPIKQFFSDKRGGGATPETPFGSATVKHAILNELLITNFVKVHVFSFNHKYILPTKIIYINSITFHMFDNKNEIFTTISKWFKPY